MNKYLKIGLATFIIFSNTLALWDILQQSEEALYLEYILLGVSLLSIFTYFTYKMGLQKSS